MPLSRSLPCTTESKADILEEVDHMTLESHTTLDSRSMLATMLRCLSLQLRATRLAPGPRAVSMSTAAPDVSAYYSTPPSEDTNGFIMQQTMIRVKDPIKSLDFYTKTLGFNLIMHREFPQWKFNVYFVAQVDPSVVPKTADEQWNFCMKTPGCIELTWNYGSEEAEGLVYNTGNSDATGTADGQNVRGGFGHLGITVPDVYEACRRFGSLGCTFTKTPNSGGMKGLAFIKDPDGYLIEILPQDSMVTKEMDHAGVPLSGDGQGYKDNSK